MTVLISSSKWTIKIKVRKFAWKGTNKRATPVVLWGCWTLSPYRTIYEITWIEVKQLLVLENGQSLGATGESQIAYLQHPKKTSEHWKWGVRTSVWGLWKAARPLILSSQLQRSCHKDQSTREEKKRGSFAVHTESCMTNQAAIPLLMSWCWTMQ